MYLNACVVESFASPETHEGRIPDFDYVPVVTQCGERHIENNRYALRRLDTKYKVTEDQLTRLGRVARQDGSPSELRSSMGKIVTQTPLGASQGGHISTLSDELAVTDFCVAQLPAIKRAVHDVNYIHCIGQTKEQKRRFLLRHFNIRMSGTAWDHNLHGVREIVMVLTGSIKSLLADPEATKKVERTL